MNTVARVVVQNPMDRALPIVTADEILARGDRLAARRRAADRRRPGERPAAHADGTCNPGLPGDLAKGIVTWQNEMTITLDPGVLNNATVSMNSPNRDGDR